MKLVVDTLNNNGHDAYCNLFDPAVKDIQLRGNDIQEIFARAFEVIETKEALVAIVTSPNKSVGQIIEIGTALSQGKPVYLFEHSSAVGSTYLAKLATASYVWSDLDSLQSALSKI
jgi:nucleoside 2-deoxyribosyltransferase